MWIYLILRNNQCKCWHSIHASVTFNFSSEWHCVHLWILSIKVSSNSKKHLDAGQMNMLHCKTKRLTSIYLFYFLSDVLHINKIYQHNVGWLQIHRMLVVKSSSVVLWGLSQHRDQCIHKHHHYLEVCIWESPQQFENRIMTHVYIRSITRSTVYHKAQFC